MIPNVFGKKGVSVVGWSNASTRLPTQAQLWVRISLPTFLCCGITHEYGTNLCYMLLYDHKNAEKSSEKRQICYTPSGR